MSEVAAIAARMLNFSGTYRLSGLREEKFSVSVTVLAQSGFQSGLWPWRTRRVSGL
jgi:hypothetical protein